MSDFQESQAFDEDLNETPEFCYSQKFPTSTPKKKRVCGKMRPIIEEDEEDSMQTPQIKQFKYQPPRKLTFAPKKKDVSFYVKFK